MTRLRTISAASLCLLPQLFSGALFPWIPLTYLAPLITSSYYRLSLRRALWLSFASGLLVDLLSGGNRLGPLAAAYCLTTLLLYPQRRHFFPNRLSTIPFLSTLFGLIVTLLSLLTTPLSFPRSLSWHWALSDLLVMPLADGLFALLGFSLPLALLFRRRKKKRRYRMARPE